MTPNPRILELARACRHYGGNVRCIRQARLAREMELLRPVVSARRWNELVAQVNAVLAQVLRHG